jgi:hypothetical protein
LFSKPVNEALLQNFPDLFILWFLETLCDHIALSIHDPVVLVASSDRFLESTASSLATRKDNLEYMHLYQEEVGDVDHHRAEDAL